MMRTLRTLMAAATLLILAACGGDNSNTFPEAVITSVNPTVVTPGAEFTVTGSNYYAVNGAGVTRIEACGITVNGSLVEPLTSNILLPPGSIIAAEVSNIIVGTMPTEGFTVGSSDVRVVRPDGSTAVLDNAIRCEFPSPEPTPVVAVLTAGNTTGVAPFTVTFSAAESSGEGELEYAWDFGVEGSTAAGVEVEFEYLQAGSYTVSLTVTDETGATAEATQVITVHPTVTARFTHSGPIGHAPVTIHFDATSSIGIAPLSYAWDFGDELGTSSEAEPRYEYLEGGSYTVNLTVTDATGATDTVAQVIAVDAAPASVMFTVPNFDNYNELVVDIFNADDNTVYHTWVKGDPPVRITEPGNYYATAHTPVAFFDEAERSYSTFERTPRYDFTVNPTDSGLRIIDLSTPQQVMAVLTLTSKLPAGYDDTSVSKIERFYGTSWVEVNVSLELSSLNLEPGVYRFTTRTVTVNRVYWTEVLAAAEEHVIVGLSSGANPGLHFEYEVLPSLGVSIVQAFPDAEQTFTLTDMNNNQYDQNDTQVPPGEYSIEFDPIDVVNPDGRNGISPTYERFEPSDLVQTIYLSSNQQLTRTQDYGAPSQPAIRLTISGPEGPMPPFQGDVRINRQGSMMVVDADGIQNATIHPLEFGRYCVEANDTTNFVVTNISHAEPNNCFDLDTSYDHQGGDHTVDVTINYEARDITAFIHFPDHPTNEVPAGTPVRLIIDVTTTEDLKYVTYYFQINDNPKRYLSGTHFGGNRRNYSVDRTLTGQAFQAGDQVKIIVEVDTVSETDVTFESPPLQIVP